MTRKEQDEILEALNKHLASRERLVTLDADCGRHKKGDTIAIRIPRLYEVRG